MSVCTVLAKSTAAFKSTSTSDSQIDVSLCVCTADDPQVEDLRGELLRMRKEKTELQRARREAFQPAAQPRTNHTDGEEERSGQRGPGTEFRSESTGEDLDAG